MRTLTIHYNPVRKQNILFDGPKGSRDDKYRVFESPTLIELLGGVLSDSDTFNPDKAFEIYFEGYTSEEKHSMELFLRKKLPRAVYLK